MAFSGCVAVIDVADKAAYVGAAFDPKAVVLLEKTSIFLVGSPK